MKQKLNKVIDFIKENQDKIFAIVFTIIYAIVTLIMAFYHENWRDENQVYLLCKNLSFFDLIVQLKYEGHPFLWFLLVYPFAQLGVSCKIVNILAWLAMTISVYIILKKAPFGKIPKLALIFTYPMMYQYVIVGRNYSLIILFVTLISALDGKRKEYPIIYAILLALLANSHLIMVGLVGMITITFYMYELIINRKNNTKEENKKLLIGLLIIIFAGLLLLVQLIRTLGASASELPQQWDIMQLVQSTIRYLFNYADIILEDYKFIFDIIILLYIAVGIWEYRKETIVFLGALLFQCIIFSILGIMEGYMAISILSILMYAMWTATNKLNSNKSDNKKKKYIIIMFEVMLIIIALLSFKQIKNIYNLDYKYNYSSASELANYIDANIEEDAIFITNNDAQCSTIIGYTKNSYKFWNIRTKDYYTFVTWTWEREKDIEVEEVEKSIQETFINNDNLYYIACTYVKDELKENLIDKGELHELYITKKALIGREEFTLYKLTLNE